MDDRYSIVARLQDPRGVLKENPELLRELQEKISSCMTRMCRSPKSGGNPFIFSYTSGKPHEITNELHGQKITTAATDGRKYYWSPDFLKKLDIDEAEIVMEHEAYHTVFFHPSRGKSVSDSKIWNWAVDYVVNAVIEVEVEKNARKIQLWNGNLGKPLPFQELLSYIDGNSDFGDDGAMIFADKTLYGRDAMSIYDEIMDHIKKSPRKCPVCGALSMNPKTGKPNKKGQSQGNQGQGNQGQGGQGQGNQGQGGCCQGNQPGQGGGCCGQDGDCCPNCGSEYNGIGSLDNHVPNAADKQEIMGDVMRAKQAASMMRGSVPAAIDELLGELQHPTVKFTDIIRSACINKSQEAGLHNNWKRLRRRYLPGVRPSAHGYKGQYLPTRHTHKPRWLAFIDTSGSMSSNDLIYAVSQLQCLGDTDGYVVPMDASVKWDDATHVKKADKSNLQKVKITGRGGTDFTEALRDYEKNMGGEWDCIIILTDGECGTYPINLKPKCDLVWVLTRSQPGWSQSFGRVVPLRTEKM